MKKLPQAELLKRIKEIVAIKYTVTDDQLQKLAPSLLERAHTFGDIKTVVESGEIDYFFNNPSYTATQLLWKGRGDIAKTKERLQATLALVESINATEFTGETVKNAIWDFATKEGRGEVLWPMRFALSGREKSPDPFVLAEMLGKETTLNRLNKAINVIANEI